MSFTVRHSLINQDDGSWPAQTDIHCFYCAHSFATMPLTAPKSRISVGGKYVTDGVFCGLPCALKYTDINAGFNAEEEKMLLRVMARDVFKMPDAFHAKNAVDARNLRIFGGHMTVEEFRLASSHSGVPIKTLTAPFVQAHMVTVVPPTSAAAAAVVVPPISQDEGSSGGAVIRGLRRPSQLVAPPLPDIISAPLFTPLAVTTAVAVLPPGPFQSTFSSASGGTLPLKPRVVKKSQLSASKTLPSHASLLQFISTPNK